MRICGYEMYIYILQYYIILYNIYIYTIMSYDYLDSAPLCISPQLGCTWTLSIKRVAPLLFVAESTSASVSFHGCTLAGIWEMLGDTCPTFHHY